MFAFFFLQFVWTCPSCIVSACDVLISSILSLFFSTLLPYLHLIDALESLSEVFSSSVFRKIPFSKNLTVTNIFQSSSSEEIHSLSDTDSETGSNLGTLEDLSQGESTDDADSLIDENDSLSDESDMDARTSFAPKENSEVAPSTSVLQPEGAPSASDQLLAIAPIDVEAQTRLAKKQEKAYDFSLHFSFSIDCVLFFFVLFVFFVCTWFRIL